MSGIRRGRTAGWSSSRRQVHAGDASVLGEREVSVVGSECVDMHRTVRGLSSDVLIQRVPSNALDEMIVLCDLTNHIAWYVC